jgi:hypothetical protein
MTLKPLVLLAGSLYLVFPLIQRAFLLSLHILFTHGLSDELGNFIASFTQNH